MKTFAIAFVTVVAVSSVLVSLGAMSGYLDLNIEFGLKEDIAATQTSNSPDRVIIVDNDESDTVTQVQVPPSKPIFWYQTPFKTIFWKPESAELLPMEYAELDWPMTKEIDWGDSVYDPPEMIEDPNLSEPIPIPEPITIPAPDHDIVPLPPVIICDPATETSSE